MDNTFIIRLYITIVNRSWKTLIVELCLITFQSKIIIKTTPIILKIFLENIKHYSKTFLI